MGLSCPSINTIQLVVHRQNIFSLVVSTILFVCSVVPIYHYRAMEEKMWTASSVSWLVECLQYRDLNTNILIFGCTLHTSKHALYCCHCWLYTCTPCCPKYQNIPYHNLLLMLSAHILILLAWMETLHMWTRQKIFLSMISCGLNWRG